jgi:hypothetical protein
VSLRTSHLVLQLLIASACAVPVTAQSPEVIVEIDRQQIYEGESFQYRVTLNHVDDPKAPDLTGFDEFDVAPAGEQSINISKISIVNGRRTESVRRGRQYDYRLTPRKAGNLTIPAPTATVDGRTLTGRTLDVQVIAPEQQDTAILEYRVDRQSVYPMQPFTVSLTVATRALPGRFSDQDPLTVQQQPPVLAIPWLDDNQLAKQLESKQSWQQVLEPVMSRRGYGFQVNSIGSSSAFSLFENRAAGFHPAPRKVVRKDLEGNDADYWEYEFRRTFHATTSGPLKLGPVTLKGTFADTIENDRLTGTEIYAVAGGLDIVVKNVPTEDQPASYIGAIGTFQLDTQLTPAAANVGDPVTLTIILTGEGNLQDARPPRIDSESTVSDRFRTYDATEETVGKSRRFVYSLRPLSADVTEFPSIPVSYFDVQAEKYVTLLTEAIPMEVREAEVLSGTEIVAGGRRESNPNEPEKSAGGIFANASQLSSLRNDRVRPLRWFAAWCIILFTGFGGSIGIGQIRRYAGDSGLALRKAAPATAAACLAEAENKLKDGDSAAASDAVRRSITGIVAAWADIPQDGLTGREATEYLSQMGVAAALIEESERLLQECDATRYGASEMALTELIFLARKLITELVGELRRNRNGGLRQ